MAAVPVCLKLSYKDHLLQPPNSVKPPDKSPLCVCSASPQCCSSSDARKRWQIVHPIADISKRTRTRGLNALKVTIPGQCSFHSQNTAEVSILPKIWSIKQENFSMGSNTSRTGRKDKQLRLLDSYFGKLQGDANQPSLDLSNETAESIFDRNKEIDTMEELQSLNSYLGKLSKDANYTPSTVVDQKTEVIRAEKLLSVYENTKRDDQEKVKRFAKLRNKDTKSSSRRSQASQNNEETSDLYLISILLSINIAIFLFELASPVRNSEFELFTLPLICGAKINDLILMGEWWRLVTPMFLHSGFFHLGLGCWSLFTFGPQVCKAYGSFTFLLICILGGISGNLTSFLHTPDPTVGGTGPIFAVIGAWLVYQMQNKDAIDKDVSDSLFQKAIVTTGLSFILSHFGPIDDWTHLGAIITGIVYGYFTCPTMRMDNRSSTGSGQEEGIAVIKGLANPCKSLALFAVFVFFLSSLVFIMEPPLDTLEPDDLAWFWKQDMFLP